MNPLVVLPLLVAAALAAPTNLLAGYPYAHAAYAAPAIAYAAPAVAYAAPIETRIHYADTPVVTGYQSQIFKPAISAAAFASPAVVAVAEPVAEAKAEKVEIAAPAPVVHVAAAPFAYSAPIAYSAPVTVDLKAPVPAGDAPSFDELVQTEKVLAPVRAVSKITPQYTVQLAPKVNVEKVPVDVHVPHAVPVAVHTPVIAAAAPATYVVETKY